MLFEDYERQIYSPEGSDEQFDPLAVLRHLEVACGGELAGLVADWKGAGDLGDVSAGAAAGNLAAARAEDRLAAASRAAFRLPDFPDCLDATALEYLVGFLDWVKKKRTPGGT